MTGQLYPGKEQNRQASKITLILMEHERETGEALYDELQSTDYTQMVTENEWLRITGARFIPKGHGRKGGRNRDGGRVNRDLRNKSTMIPLPPQDFNWGDITPESERGSHINRSFPVKYKMLNVLHPFRGYWDMWLDGYSREEIAREHGRNFSTVGSWVNLMIELEGSGDLEEWLEIVELLAWFSEDRGHQSFKDSRKDTVMLFVHSLADDYVSSPMEEERIDPRELVGAYRFACMEEEE